MEQPWSLVGKMPQTVYMWLKFLSCGFYWLLVGMTYVLNQRHDIAYSPKFQLTRHVSTRLDTFDMLSTSRRACRAVLFDKLDMGKIHGLDASNVSCRVETSVSSRAVQQARHRQNGLDTSRRDVTSQVEFGLLCAESAVKPQSINLSVNNSPGKKRQEQ